MAHARLGCLKLKKHTPCARNLFSLSCLLGPVAPSPFRLNSCPAFSGFVLRIDQRGCPTVLLLIFGKLLSLVTLGCLKLVWRGWEIQHAWQGPAGPARPPGPSPHPNLKQKWSLLSPNLNPFLCLSMHIFFSSTYGILLIHISITLLRSDMPENDPMPLK